VNKNRANAWNYVTGEDRWSEILDCRPAAIIQKKVKDVFEKWISRPV
jgi:hypothetical protein